jgi:hypothetical protein
MEVTLTSAAKALISLDGVPFSFDDWPMHKQFYDGRYRRTLFKTARQVAKSTTLANVSVLECCLIPFFRTMFVSPSKEQTTQFSNSRVGKVMRYSPLISRNFLVAELSDRVLHKQFSNGSEMIFTYACDSDERLRGPSADRVLIDELQDLLYDPVVLVANETMAESKYAFETYAGTPKTMENSIQFLWERSTQSEWAMKCQKCSKYFYVDNEKAIGKNGPICVCGGYVNPFEGQWIDMYPDRTLKGFHISQPIMPRNVPLAMQNRTQKEREQADIRWKRILQKYEENPIATFRNEVLGVSDEIGTRMLSQEELEALCVGKSFSDYAQNRMFMGMNQIVAGVDWSGGGTSGVSRTVLWIWGYRPNDAKLVCLLYKVYPGRNPVAVVDEITSLCKQYNVAFVVGDAGEGSLANDLLRKGLGPARISQVQYGMQDKAMKFNGIDRYHADRTTLIDNFFMLLKKKQVELGPVSEMKVAIDDILNEYEEVTTAGRKVWRHSPSKPDDCLHAGLFAWIAWKIVNGDLKFWQE